MTRVLWTTGPKGITPKMKTYLRAITGNSNINFSDVYFAGMYSKSNETLTVTKNRKLILDPAKLNHIKEKFNDLIHRIKPTHIIINDEASLLYIAGQYSLQLCRGSVYFYGDIPCIVIDRLNTLHAQKQGMWIFLNDIQKLGRWIKNEQRSQPKFTYSICRTLAAVQEILQLCGQSVVLSTDLETKSMPIITCVGYSLLLNNGIIRNFVIPMWDPTKPGNCFWETPELEARVWDVIKNINSHVVPKILQNGTYDCAYFIYYRIPLQNYFLDTLHLMHSIWPESQKKLNFISSIMLDYCRYWKDEIKGDGKDERITPEGIEKYWRYCALDCYNTLLDMRMLLKLYKNFDWIKFNYNVEFETQIGPNMAMCMRGMCIDLKQRTLIGSKLLDEATTAKAKLKIMVDSEEFNPNSDDQVASLLYDVLGATPIKHKGKTKGTTKKRESVDKRILRRIAEQHPIFDIFIQAIWDVKEPNNNISKYMDMKLHKNRFMYSVNCGATVTWRANAKKHQLYVGTNAQNIPEDMRHQFRADDGYFLVNADYSASDAVFMAHESGDEQYIKNVTSGKDMHSLHAAHFFKLIYEEVLQGVAAEKAANKYETYNHPQIGIRPLSKRITHGTNFMMGAFTLYMYMGRPGIVAGAKMFGYTNAYQWDMNRCVQFCGELLESFYVMYTNLQPFYGEIKERLLRDKSVTNALGMKRIFFGDLNSETILREAVAFIGQGDTAGNINKSLRRYWYDSDIEEQGAELLLQVHDSILAQIPIRRAYLVDNLLTIMDNTIIIPERTRKELGKEVTMPAQKFNVSVDADVGIHWKKGMIKWKTGMTGEHILNETTLI